MTRTAILNQYEYLIAPDGILFRKAGNENQKWTRCSNFSVEIVGDCVVADGEAWCMTRWNLPGYATAERFMRRRDLHRVKWLACDILGAPAVVFPIRGAQVRMHSAVLAHWLLDRGDPWVQAGSEEDGELTHAARNGSHQ